MSTGAAQSFEARTVFSADAGEVWSLLADLGNREVADGFADIAVAGTGEGAIRTLWLSPEAGGGMLRERIETFDPAARRYVYRVLEFGPMPFAAYRGQLHITEVDTGHSALHYTADFIPLPSLPADEATKIAASSFAHLCRNLEAALDRRRAS